MMMPGRKYDAGSGYRYGFNGKEDDKDINEGGQDYGMRIYDARLGRFLSVDPLTDKYPWYTPYQFAGNIPIAAIDLDGAEPQWIKDLFNAYRPYAFTRDDLISGGFKNKVYDQVAGPGKFDKKNRIHILRFHQILGNIFQDAVLRSMSKTANTSHFYPDPANRKDWFVPDEIHTTAWVYIQASRSGVYTTTVLFPNGGIVEVKSTKEVEFDPGYDRKNDPQFKKTIDYLAQVKDEGGNYLAVDFGCASLTIVCPAGTTIDQKIVDYATSKNVRLYMSWTCKDPKDGKLKVSETATGLNTDKIKSIHGGEAVLWHKDVTPANQSQDTKKVDINWAFTIGW